MAVPLPRKLSDMSFSALKLAGTAAVFVFILLVGTIYTFLQPRLYEAHARVWVQSKLSSDYSANHAGPMQSPFTYTFTSPITTASEVVRSAAVLKEARDYLVNSLPEKDVPSVGELRARLKVDPVRDADILDISYRDGRNWVTAAVVKSVIDGFVRINNSQNAGNAGQSRVFLEQELKLATEQYLKARTNLKEFQDKNQAVDLSQQTSALLKQSNDLQRELESARAKISQAHSKISFLERELGVSPENALALELLSKDEMLQMLKQKSAQEEVKIINLRSKLQDDHPRLKQAMATHSELQKAMAERVQYIVGRFDPSLSTTHIPAETPVRQTLVGQMLNARTEELAEETRVSFLETALADANARLKAIPSQQVVLAELTRAAQVAAETVSEVERRLQSAKLSESLANKTSNVQVLDEPEVPTAPTYPNTSLFLLVTLIAASVGAGITYYSISLLDPRVKRVDVVTRALSLPLINWLNPDESSAGLLGMLPAMRRLRHAVRSWLADGRKKILVTAADEDEDRSLVAASLASSCVEAGMKVLLIDANLTRPGLHPLFGTTASPGLVDFVTKYPNTPPSAVLRTVRDNLLFVPAGAVVQNSGFILNSAAFNKLIEEMSPLVDVIILDTAAITDTADGLSLIDDSTQVVFVVPMKRALRRSLNLAATQLQHQPVAHAGLILTNVDDRAVSKLLMPGNHQNHTHATPTTSPTPIETTPAMW